MFFTALDDKPSSRSLPSAMKTIKKLTRYYEQRRISPLQHFYKSFSGDFNIGDGFHSFFSFSLSFEKFHLPRDITTIAKNTI
jgi:hypothetical protein